MAPGEIFLANFPYGGSTGVKLRPTLLLTGPLGTVPEVVVADISSVVPAVLLPTDIVLDPANPQHALTNFKAVSVLRLHKLATIHKRSLARHLGVIAPHTERDVADRLRGLLKL